MENKLDVYAPTVLPLCDMIKRNKLDVGNIDSELKSAKKDDKYVCSTFFRNFKKSFISLEPDDQLKWGLAQNVAFEMDK